MEPFNLLLPSLLRYNFGSAPSGLFYLVALAALVNHSCLQDW